jgi:hypothetical protein
LGSLFPIYVKKNVPNHQPENMYPPENLTKDRGRVVSTKNGKDV